MIEDPKFWNEASTQSQFRLTRFSGICLPVKVKLMEIPAEITRYPHCDSRPADASVVVPVIDIRNGWAVHAIAGNRADYRPWTDTSNRPLTPQQLAEEFSKIWQPRWLYVADLDGIIDGQPQTSCWPRLPGDGLRILMDAGFREIDDVLTAVNLGYEVILGTESLPSMAWLQELIVRLEDSQRLWISLDFRQGQWQAPVEFQQLGLTDFISQLTNWSMTHWIVLDLADVGQGTGGSTAEQIRLLRETLEKSSRNWKHPAESHQSRLAQSCQHGTQAVPTERTPTILAGGGMRTAQDVLQLQTQGVSGVLVATALMTGAMTPDQFAH